MNLPNTSVFLFYEGTDKNLFTDMNSINLNAAAKQLLANDVAITSAFNSHAHGDLYYTKAESDAKFTDIIGSAPEALDAIGEIAAALDNDPDFATNVTATLASKVDNSRVLTDVPANAKFTDTEYTHPEYDGDNLSIDVGPLTGAHVISNLDIDLVTDTTGHVVSISKNVVTRPITYTDVGALGASAKAADSDKLDGKDATDFLLATGKAVDSTLFNGVAINQFLQVGDNAVSANKLNTARTLALTGAVTGSGSFDGSQNLSITTTLAPHNHDTSYLGKTERASDSDLLDGYDSSYFASASSLSNYLGVNARAADSLLFDGLASSAFLRVGGTAVDSQKLGGQAAANFPLLSAALNTFTGGTNVFRGDVVIGGQPSSTSWLTLSGADGSTDRTGISIGESGKWGSAGLHMYYTGDGYAHIGMGVMSDSTHAANRAMSLYYNSNKVTFLGEIDGQSTVRENGQALSARYLGLNATANNADKLDGVHGSSFLRSDTADSINATLTLNESILVDDTHRNVSLIGTLDRGKTQQIWARDASSTLPADGSSFGNLTGLSYYHPSNGSGTLAGGDQIVYSHLGVPRVAFGFGLWCNSDIVAEGNVKEQGALLSTRYLGLTAKAADSNLLDGQDSSYFLPATGKAADSNLLDGQDSTYYATASSLNTKLGTNSTAKDSYKLGGQSPAFYATADTVGAKLDKSATAYDSDRLGGVDSSNFLRINPMGFLNHSVMLPPTEQVRVGSFGNQLSLSHDGGDATVSTQSGDLVLSNYTSGKGVKVEGNYLKVGMNLIDIFEVNFNGVVVGSDFNSSYLSVLGGCYIDQDLTVGGETFNLSDRRLKTNEIKITDALNKVSQLTGYTYTRSDRTSERREVGIFAQDLMAVLPEAVSGGPTEENQDAPYAVAYGNTVALLIEAIKELKTEIDILKQGE